MRPDRLFFIGTLAVALGTLIALAVAYYVSRDSISKSLNSSPLAKLLFPQQ